jgi:PIN domain nuclease of toxin-antitoxin system
MKAVLDSHALFWYLTADPKLSSKAKFAIESYETIVIPTIVLLESFEICLAKGKADLFTKLLESLPTDTLVVYPLDLSLVRGYAKIPRGKIDMHDRIILAVAQGLNLPIITKDEELSKIYPKIIW